MGEYALRLSDKREIKIGTCESMYYLRFEDINKIHGADTPDLAKYKYYFRLPFEDEDAVLPGNYTDAERSSRLINGYKPPEQNIQQYSIQLKHPCGLLINIPCTHGEALPEMPAGANAHWNGKLANFWELTFIKSEPNGTSAPILRPIVKCLACGTLARDTWDNILEHVPENQKTMRKRLLGYQQLSAKE